MFKDKNVSPSEALQKLKEGNGSFIVGELTQPKQDAGTIKGASTGQKPFAIIIGYPASRAHNEIILDQ